MKRSRSHITALNIFVVVGYSIVPYITGEDVFQNQDSDYPGSQFISEDCAPARRKQIIKVNSVELLCDSQENDDGSRYGDSPSCRAGDDAKAAVSCTFDGTWNNTAHSHEKLHQRSYFVLSFYDFAGFLCVICGK